MTAPRKFISHYFSRWQTAVELALVVLVAALLFACGQQTSSGNLNATGSLPNSSSNWQGGDPGLPVSDSCTAGDNDIDGVCDDIDLDSNNPDVDSDGAPDGLDNNHQPIKAGSNGSGGFLGWNYNSDLENALIVVGGLMLTAVALDELTDRCINGPGADEFCVSDITYQESTLELKGQGPNRTLKFSRVKGKVKKEKWFTAGANWGRADITIDFSYALQSSSSLLASLTIPGTSVDEYFHTELGVFGVSRKDDQPEITCQQDEEGCTFYPTRYVGRRVASGGCNGNILQGNGVKMTITWIGPNGSPKQSANNPIEDCVDYDALPAGSSPFGPTGVSKDGDNVLGLLFDQDGGLPTGAFKDIATGAEKDGEQVKAAIPFRFTTDSAYESGTDPFIGRVFTPSGL